MAAVKAAVHASPIQCVPVDWECGENGSTIDQLPRGTALHAARTPLAKDGGRAAPSTIASPHASKLVHSNSTSSSLNTSSDHEDVSTASESTDTEAPANSESLRKAPSAADLARKAARRVNVWKRSEQERRGEEERARQAKLEQEKRRQTHAAHVKHRRRAEIYALNALLRQLQQEKVARYISAQKQLQEVQLQAGCQNGASLASTTAALAQVRAVGV
jgi:hypothetical protein